MSRQKCIIKIIFFYVYLAYTYGNSKNDIEHMFRIPYPVKVLNFVKNREVRQQLGLNTIVHNNEECDYSTRKHHPICPQKIKVVLLNDEEYENRPSYYEEVFCDMAPDNCDNKSDKVCSGFGLPCIQWNKTIHLTRRRYNSDCWESRTLVIPAGCECMWPNNGLGGYTPNV